MRLISWTRHRGGEEFQLRAPVQKENTGRQAQKVLEGGKFGRDMMQNFNWKALSRKIDSNDNWNDRIGAFGKGTCDGSIFSIFLFAL